jgi:hypothetical protein
LRDEESTPLEYDGGPARLPPDRRDLLPPVRISRREAFSFALARKLLAHYEAAPLHMDMRAVLDKIAELLEGDISIEPDSVGVGALLFVPHDGIRLRIEAGKPKSYDTDLLETLVAGTGWMAPAQQPRNSFHESA